MLSSQPLARLVRAANVQTCHHVRPQLHVQQLGFRPLSRSQLFSSTKRWREAGDKSSGPLGPGNNAVAEAKAKIVEPVVAKPKKPEALLSEKQVTNKEQRKADWAIIKEMSHYLWPKVGKVSITSVGKLTRDRETLAQKFG